MSQENIETFKRAARLSPSSTSSTRDPRPQRPNRRDRRIRMRDRQSGVETESPLISVTDVKNGRGIRVWNYLDPKEALEASGLSE
jgi:hypothetical protein